MKEALRARLKAGITAGSIEWGVRPQGKPLPAVILNDVGSPRDYTMEGAQVTQQYRVRVECWADSFKGAHTTAESVAALLEQPSGQFQAGFVLMRSDDHELTDEGMRFRSLLDIKITHIPA